MTLKLVLTRHAKSSWSDPTLDDFDRPLNGRGRRSATAIGQWIAEAGHVPAEVVVSGARRTVDTWSAIARELPDKAPMRSDPALYHASAPSILAVLRGLSAPSAMIIGHNPGIADFAERIVNAPADHPRYADFPTCATAVIEFGKSHWRDVDWGDGTLVAFVLPRELLE
ncbi:SixA phosphatase family protein [Ovoidimarina sediminis]|uniref:SixA phosphatase family protein n=1 Tax=Ovoidimarina sediminis TaxID=3079856 RepID=UPI0029135548|nr:histidine phosphatase family protein [Rhodophyticola sp. MJ-SS7]MDU8946315.1 histidine phosphatase family protein [Rhodophyticola sp. MJ-SS7]